MYDIRMPRAHPLRVAWTIGLVAVLGSVVRVKAGDLNPPPGPITPTMKTLDEVEPRTPIHAADLPLTITAPGSYYLAENITTTGGGITIDADGVTLDLMGFTLSGGTGSGIAVSGVQRAIAIRNGTVSNWAAGGVVASIAWNSQFEMLRIQDNGSGGLSAGSGSTVRACVADGNGGYGIYTSSSCSIVGCTARSNGLEGIQTGGRCVLRDCVAEGNGVGIRLNNDCAATHCIVRGNTGKGIDQLNTASGGSILTSCLSEFNGDTGITVGDTSTIKDCSVRANDGGGIVVGGNSVVSGCAINGSNLDGIRLSSYCLVTGNALTANGIGPSDGACIHATGLGNRIEGNNVLECDRGIDVDMSDNVIIKNTARANTVNYDIVANNMVGVIVNAPNSPAISGSTGGVGVGTTDPWANFSY